VTNGYTYENDRLKTIAHNGFSYTFGYDALGNNTTVSAGSQTLITNSFDLRTGRLLESTYGNGHKVAQTMTTWTGWRHTRYGTVLQASTR